MSISHVSFGTLSNGEQAELYTITNASGAYVKLSTLGCAIVSICVPGKDGVLSDVVLGYDTAEEYRKKPRFIGVVVGRFANRIANGCFPLLGKEIQLEKNNNGNALHGGSVGFDKYVWRVVATTENSLTLEHESPDGDGGYPGNLCVQLTYTFTDDNDLILHYLAKTDAPTVLNLTHHCYFNLAGHGNMDISDQTIQVFSDAIVEVNDKLIPTGELFPVAGTPCDLNEPVSFGYIHSQIGIDPHITKGKGLDFNYVLKGEGLRKIAVVKDPASGRVMETFTDLPGVQAYSGGNLIEEIYGKDGHRYMKNGAFCLETQFFPDSPNHPNFPSSVLMPEDVYDHTTIYRFSVE